MTTRQTPDAVREAVQKGLEFAVLTLAFHGRDRGTDREAKMLDELEQLARELDPMMREALAALDSRAGERAAILADISQRNAGKPVVTIWADGSFVVHGFRDAEIAALCEPESVILTLDLESWNAVQFITPQQRVDLAKKLFPHVADIRRSVPSATAASHASDGGEA